MKALLLFTGIYLLATFGVLAQRAGTYKVRAGQMLVEAIPEKEQYRFDKFEKGCVVYYNNKQWRAMLNYNVLFRQVQAIGQSGDTLNLSKAHMIKHLRIGPSVFYYDRRNGYLEVRANYGPIKLAAKDLLVVINPKPTGGYGELLGDTESIMAMGNGNLPFYINRVSATAVRKSYYFLIDQNDRIFSANRTGVSKLFPRHRRAMADYLRENRVNFRQEEDLKQLLQFGSSL
jgi:hypothetical protein